MRKTLRCFALSLLILFSACKSFTSKAYAEHYAVLIGVGSYHSSQIVTLKSPRRDVLKVLHTLRRNFGFKRSNIKVLINKKATKKSIVKALRWLRKVAKAEDTVVIYYSGHGSKVRDEANGDEKDGYDETIIAYDSTSKRETHITDDEFYTWTRMLRANKITIIFDSCHSGGGERSAGSPDQPQRKYWSNPAALEPTPLKQRSKNPIELQFNRGKVKAQTKLKMPIISKQWKQRWGFTKNALKEASTRSSQHYAFLAASNDRQYAYDAGGRMGSLFTHFLLKASKQNPKASLATLSKVIRGSLKNYNLMRKKQKKLILRAMNPVIRGEIQSQFIHFSPLGKETPDPRRLVASGFKKIKGFHASFQIMNSKGELCTEFKNRDSIYFSFKLNKPGHVAIIGYSDQQQFVVLYPTIYYQKLQILKWSHYVEGNRRYFIPPKTSGKHGVYFYINGARGAIEEVHLLATPDKLQLNRLLLLSRKSKKKRGSKGIYLRHELEKDQNAIRVKLRYQIVR